MSYKPRLTIDALIFSSADVLVDVNYSYREVVRKAVQIYLERTIGLPPSPETLLTSDEVILLEKAGGFTNYWDLATAFIIYFIELLPPVPVPTFPSKFHVPAIIAYLQMAGARLHIGTDKLREQKDITRLAHDIINTRGGLDGADDVLPHENRHLLVNVGDVGKTNLIGRIFQELYLGASLFESIYEQPALLVQSTGYSEHETLIIDPEALAELSRQMPLGLVADCSKIEIDHTLQARNIAPYFQTVITLDDVTAGKGKPLSDPWSLLEAARKLTPTPSRVAYVGANSGHMKAAKAANQTVPFTAIGCLSGGYDKEILRSQLENSKADIILGHPNNLKELILG